MKTITDAWAPNRCSNFYKAILLTMLVGLWAFALAPVSVARPQQTKAPQKAKPSYACPMHSEVKSTKRSKCPKCGMMLRLVRPDASAALPMDQDVSGEPENATAPPTVGTAHGEHPSTTEPSTTKMDIPDIEVLDQDGNRLHFYTDLVKGKTVAINFIFTTCTTICPPLAATFAKVQRELAVTVGKDVQLISISVDPVTDTPERLRTWGAKFKAGAGWAFVTGEKKQIDRLLIALGAAVSRSVDHSPIVIIGNEATGEWTRTYGLAKPSQLVALILKVREGTPVEALNKETQRR